MAGVFKQLVEEGKASYVQQQFIRICKDSFTTVPGRETQSAVRERMNHLFDGFAMLRTDSRYKWGLERIIKELPRYLRCRLERIPYEPDTRSIWIPEDGAV